MASSSSSSESQKEKLQENLLQGVLFGHLKAMKKAGQALNEFFTKSEPLSGRIVTGPLDFIQSKMKHKKVS